MMDFLDATEQFLAEIHDPAKRQENLAHFEYQVIFGSVCGTEQMRNITLRLVAALQQEEDPGVKHAIFWILQTAVSYCNQEAYIDWDIVIKQLPLLSEDGLLLALEMFYARLHLQDLPVLTTYVEHPSLTIRMNALNIICETVAFASNRDREVEAKLRPPNYHQLLAAMNNPARRRQVSETELEKQFLGVRNTVMAYVQTWLQHSDQRWA